MEDFNEFEASAVPTAEAEDLKQNELYRISGATRSRNPPTVFARWMRIVQEDSSSELDCILSKTMSSGY